LGNTKNILNKNLSLLVLLIVVINFFLIGCHSTEKKEDVHVSVKVDVVDSSGKRIPQVESITLEIRAPDLETFELKLNINLRSIKLKIPAGTQRTFNANVVINGEKYIGTSTLDMFPGKNTDVTIKVEVSNYAAEETQEATSTEITSTETSIEEIKFAPMVTLEKIYGPEKVGDLTVYRYRAVVTGTPEPEVVFNKDDSKSTWGKYIAQVNLKVGETFTLKVVVTNSEGSAEADVYITN